MSLNECHQHEWTHNGRRRGMTHPHIFENTLSQIINVASTHENDLFLFFNERMGDVNMSSVLVPRNSPVKQSTNEQRKIDEF